MDEFVALSGVMVGITNTQNVLRAHTSTAMNEERPRLDFNVPDQTHGTRIV